MGLSNLFSRNKLNVPDLVENGRWAYHDGNYNAAINIFKQVLELDHSNHDCMVHLANTFVEVNRHQDAIIYYKKAIALCNTIPMYRYFLASSYSEVGMEKEAQKCYRQFMTQEPDFSEAWYMLGSSYYMDNSEEDAKRCFQKYIELEPYGEFVELARELIHKMHPSESEIASIQNKDSDVLGDLAYSLSSDIRDVLDCDIDKYELVYFIQYVVCDLLKLANIDDNQYWIMTGDFQKQHLLIESAGDLGNSPELILETLNTKAIAAAEKMNLYKAKFPMYEMVEGPDQDKFILMFLTFAVTNFCVTFSDASELASTLFPILKNYIQEQLEWQEVQF